MTYQIAICDDSQSDLSYIESLVRQWAEESNNTITVHTFPSAEAFLFHYADNKSYDILLLDIEMGNMDGVELAKRIRQENDIVQIVFITGFSDYIAEGYEVCALHYLIKPLNRTKFFDILGRATQKVQKNGCTLLLSASGETVRIPAYEIRYLEVRQNYVTIHAKDQYIVKKTLGEFEQELDDRFYRMGRSYIVNLAYIRKITKTDVFLLDGSAIPLPRGQYTLLNQAFIVHM